MAAIFGVYRELWTAPPVTLAIIEMSFITNQTDFHTSWSPYSRGAGYAFLTSSYLFFPNPVARLRQYHPAHPGLPSAGPPRGQATFLLQKHTEPFHVRPWALACATASLGPQQQSLPPWRPFPDTLPGTFWSLDSPTYSLLLSPQPGRVSAPEVLQVPNSSSNSALTWKAGTRA